MLTLQLETHRLYTPAGSIPKLTTSSGADFILDDELYHLPPNVRVNLNGSALHESEEYWGGGAHEFNPRRWDRRNTKSFLARNEGAEGLIFPGLEWNHIFKPVRGAYIPFSGATRPCIGREFAQVEVVATLAVLFYKYRVTLTKLGNETDDDARNRATGALDRSSTSITLSMTDQVPLIFHERTF